jgi:nucleoid-associated protein YgaU
MARNKNDTILTNSSEYYKPLREKRKVRAIQHFETPRMYHPDVNVRSFVTSQTHIWKYGDRYYNLAFEYYGNQNLWWIIAWYNGYPTEASIENGAMIEIPLNLEEISRVLGV